MLHGRESLKRLIGKRRRTPSTHVVQLLRRHSQQDSSQVPKESDGGSSSIDIITEQNKALRAEDRPGESHEKGWVFCPVCGSTIRGDDYNVNSHLDSCLERGTKRKLNQCTLLQFQFSRGSRNKLDLDDLGDGRQDGESMVSMIGNEPGHCFATPDCDLKSTVGNHSTSDASENVPSILECCAESTSKILTIRDDGNKMAEPQFSSKISQGTTMFELDEHEMKDAHSVVTFETCIVGHRFHEDVEWKPGASIYLVRDHKNVKDTHAIKVLYPEPGCLKVVGYLPRELSRYMCPLMDNHIVECEGIVNSVPKHSFDTIPIQLICRKTAIVDENETVDVENSEYLWEALLQSIKGVKPKIPSILRCQKNFILMIEDVMKNYNHLFTTEEQSFIGSLKTLSCEGQLLFLRLYLRKGPWFRVNNISYPEIQDPHKAIEELHLAGYVYLFDSGKVPFRYDMKEVLSLLNVSELREILHLVLSKNGTNCTRRDELINALFSAYKNGSCQHLPKTILQRAGTCTRISVAADTLFSRIQRLFFLNGEQDLAAFLLVDLGIIKFPEYVCSVSNQIFHDRNVLIAYEEAIEVAQIMDESLDENNDEMVTRCIGLADSYLCNSVRKDTENHSNGTSPTFFSFFSALWVYSKVLCLGISFYERERRYKDAIKLLKGLLERISHDSMRGYLTLRLSVDLEHIGHISESLLVAEKGVLDPWVRAGSRVALQRRVLRLGKPPRRWKKPDYAYFVNRKIKEVVISGRPLTCETGIKNSYYGYDGELCGVEQLALQYYAGEGGGWQGVHSESGIWRTIFGLIMWDVIFSNVPDVFFSRFQIAPLDLYTDDFYEARKSLIESQLEKVRNGMAEEILIMSWESHFGTACRGINWERHCLSDLRAAVSCMGGHCLASLCRHLSLDYESWSSGMPDLLLWRFHGDNNQGEAKVVEVKGPRDRLSEQQRAWMLILMDIGFDTEVCKVSPISKAS